MSTGWSTRVVTGDRGTNTDYPIDCCSKPMCCADADLTNEFYNPFRNYCRLSQISKIRFFHQLCRFWARAPQLSDLKFDDFFARTIAPFGTSEIIILPKTEMWVDIPSWFWRRFFQLSSDFDDDISSWFWQRFPTNPFVGNLLSDWKKITPYKKKITP